MRTVAIIGGGFSGTMAAVNISRLADGPVRVVLINAGRPTGRGTAYGTRRPEHLLNVVARNMSALPDHPAHFLDWLRSRNEYSDLTEDVLRETFVPRRVYGDYVRGLLQAYVRPIDRRIPVTVEVIEGEAVDVVAEGERPVVLLARGEPVPADRVLLATGNRPPAPLAGSEGAPFEHPRYCPDPWHEWECRLPGTDGEVVLLGTGLTMVDAFLSLAAFGHTGPVTAVSRHGMLPRSHFRGIEYPDYIPHDSVSLPTVVRLVREQCRRLEELGQNSAIAVDKLRPHTQKLWQGFSCEEKREFLREHAARWNVARHRIPEPVHGRLTDAISEGRLRIVRAAVTGLAPRGERVAVSLRDHAGRESTITGALVVNCTGPHASFSDIDSPLFRNLVRKGLVRPDDLDLGVDVSDDFAVLDSSGEPSDWMFAIGPLLRGTLWETTAVPELRGQAMRVAQTVLDRGIAVSVPEEEVLEYCI